MELDEILKKDFVIIWSSTEIETWLEKVDLPAETKKFIREKTELLKNKQKKE